MAYETFSETQEDPPTAASEIEQVKIQNTTIREANGELAQEALPQGGFAGWRSLLLGFGLGIGFALALVGARTLHRPTPEAAPTPPQVSAPAQTITVAPVTPESVDRIMEATGTVQARDLLPILPKTTGLQIVEVLVDEGDYVEAGQLLAVLDDSVLQTQIDRAQSQVASATSTVAQAQAGVAQAESARREAQAAVAQAEAGILQAQAGSDRARVGVVQAQANLDRAKARLEQAQREEDRYGNLAASGAVSLQEAEVRQTDVRTVQEDVRVAAANLTAAQTEVENARANEANARANLESARAKLDSQIANVLSSQANVENAQAGVGADRANIAQIETQLEQTLVRAPESGLIAERMARVGDVTGGTGRLFSIIREAQLELHLQVPETQLPQVQAGVPVQITSDADSRIQLNGTVRDIAPLIDPDSRNATVKIDLPDSEGLRPGMFLQAAITTSTTSGLTIPAQAVLPQPNGRAIVYKLVGDNTVTAQPVQVGEVIGESDLALARIEVLSGLELGDRIAVSGAGYLKDGDRVQISQR